VSNEFGAGDVQVVELPDAIKTVLVRWNKVKFDLADLARLRWIKKMTLPEICQEISLGRSAVQVSIRTIRKVGISQLNLTEFEKVTVESEIKREVQKFMQEQKNFSLHEVHESFRLEVV
jgi:predicted DNA-binding protein YlxM (UPF0122 family)